MTPMSPRSPLLLHNNRLTLRVGLILPKVRKQVPKKQGTEKGSQDGTGEGTRGVLASTICRLAAGACADGLHGLAGSENGVGS